MSSITPAKFYAVNGDIVGLRIGRILSFASGDREGQTRYAAAGPVWVTAGRDIVNSAELIEWLAERYGFMPGDEAEEGGREHNDANGSRFGSYLRGRNAIAALFLEQDAVGGHCLPL